MFTKAHCAFESLVSRQLVIVYVYPESIQLLNDGGNHLVEIKHVHECMKPQLYDVRIQRTHPQYSEDEDNVNVFFSFFATLMALSLPKP